MHHRLYQTQLTPVQLKISISRQLIPHHLNIEISPLIPVLLKHQIRPVDPAVVKPFKIIPIDPASAITPIFVPVDPGP